MHVQKFNQTNFWKIIRHDTRSRGKDGEYLPRDNPDIDVRKSDDNYIIGCQDPEKEFKRLMEENTVRNKTTVVCFSWVCQKPDNYEGDLKQFFQGVYDAFKAHYGDENVISGAVHLDETTPHIHVLCAPIKDGKFNAKAILTKAELQGMHDEIEEYLNTSGIKCELTKQETKDRKELIAEMKREGILEHDENPKYVSMKELKARTQDKIFNDYLKQKEQIQDEIEERQNLLDYYNNEKSIDDVIEEHRDDLIPRKEVEQMVSGLLEMIEEDVPEDKKKKYYKYLSKFGFWFRDTIHRIKEKIKNAFEDR